MDYNHITSFLDKFKKLLFQKEASQRIIVETIEKHISYPVDVSCVKVKGTTIHIQGSPLLRNEILMHKRGILTDLLQITPESRFTDIR